jgi:DNA-binding MarR family transcriptional regulator
MVNFTEALVNTMQHASHECGARTGIDRSTLGQIAGRLVRKGLLQRRRSRKDARAKVLN